MSNIRSGGLSVPNVLRKIEQEATQIDPETPYEQRKEVRDFYSLCRVRTGHGVPSAFLRERIAKQYGISASHASGHIREAARSGLIVRLGAGSDTRYATVEAEAALEVEAKANDSHLFNLGARLIGHGLSVSYEMDHTYQQRSHGEAIALVREQGWHVQEVRLETPLEGLAAVLEGLAALPGREQS